MYYGDNIMTRYPASGICPGDNAVDCFVDCYWPIILLYSLYVYFRNYSILLHQNHI